LVGVAETLRNRREDVRNSAPRERQEKGNVRHPRSSALQGHVDYVEFAERVSLGITVDGKPITRRRDPR
jgi:hypothetical protein